MSDLLSIDIQCRRKLFSLAINIDIQLNGILGVFGHSGSGKTTLLRTIAGLNEGSVGTLKFNENLLINSEKEHFVASEKRQISMVFQDARLFPHLSVHDNLLFAAKRCKNPRLNIDEIIELTEIPSLLQKSIGQISSGEKQRVALARAILSEPKLLLLDEPLSALDNKSKIQLLSLLKKVNQSLNLPMIYVSHHLDELQHIANDLLTLNKGKVIHYGDLHQVIHQLNHTGEIKQQTSLSLPIAAIDKKYALLSLQLNNRQQIQLPYQLSANFKIRDVVRCTIFADDISISIGEPLNSSIVNRLPATLIDIEQINQQVLLTLQCGEQQFFANISTYSFERLKLHKHQEIYMQFKASAVHTFRSTTC